MTAAIARFFQASFDRPEPPPPTLTELCQQLDQQPRKTPHDELRASSKRGPVRVKTSQARFTSLDARDRHQQNAYDLVRKSFYRTARILTKGIQNKVTRSEHRRALREVWDEHGLCEKPAVGAQTIRLRQVFVIREKLVIAAEARGLDSSAVCPTGPITASTDFVWEGQAPRNAPSATRPEDLKTREQKYRQCQPSVPKPAAQRVIWHPPA